MLSFNPDTMELDASQINYDNEETDKKEVGYGKVEQTNVRRKLFQEDGTENNEEYQDFGTVTICEQGNQMAQKNWNRETKDENRTESKSYGKEEGVSRNKINLSLLWGEITADLINLCCKPHLITKYCIFLFFVKLYVFLDFR